MRLRLLGAVEVRVDDRVITVGSRQQRLVLALLAWEVNRLVPVSRLVEWVWPESPPGRAAHAIRVYVSQLRSVLAANRVDPAEAAIVTQGPGYLLRMDPRRIDVHRFQSLVGQARQALGDAAKIEVLDEALGLWRGPVLADIAPESTQRRLGAAIEETRLAAVEDRADALLRTGGHRAITEDLISLVDAHPARERLVSQLALALYRGGQASAALDVLRRTRQYLANELGIDPDDALQRLEVAILRKDAELDLHRPADAPVPGPESTMVGRSHEMGRLLAAREQAASDGPAVVLLEGAPGIGKTTLLAEFARREGMAVLWGAGTAEDGAPSFWPWRQVLRRWLASTDPASVTVQLGDSADAIARIVPEARRTPNQAGPLDATPATPEERFALFDHVTGVVTRAAAAAGGLVIVLDDLHWADPASLLLFTHLARNARQAPLLLVGAFRAQELHQNRGGEHALAELTRLPNTSRVELAGLSTDEVARQLDVLTGQSWDRAEAATVAARTAGNPLFVREIARHAAAPGPSTELPAGLRDAVREHLRVVSPASRAILATASVLGTGIDPFVLAAASAAPIEDVLGALDEGLATAVVRPTTEGAGYRFAHDLVREGLLLETAPGERARIHLRAAQHFESIAGTGHLHRIAHHRVAALPLGDPSDAVRAATEAARLSMNQLAYEDAVELFDQALAAQDGHPSAPGARGELMIGKATAQYLAYEVADAMATCTAAAALAEHTGDVAGLGQAALVLADVADPAWLATITPWCVHALAELPARDSVLRARLLAQQVVIATAQGDAAHAAQASGVALAMAEQLDDPGALVAALRARQHACASPEGNGQRLELGDRMHALSSRTGDSTALWGYLWRFDALMQAGRVDDAEIQLDLLEPVVTRLRQPLAQVHLHRSRAAVHHGRGHFADAYKSLDEACRLAELGNHANVLAGTEFTRVFFDTMTKRGVVSPEDVGTVQKTLPVPVVQHLAFACFYLQHGRVADARRYYRQVPPLARLPFPPSVRLIAYAQYAEAAAACGDTDGAWSVYELLLPYAEFHVAAGTAVLLTRGSVHHFLGIAAAGCGRTDTAIDHFRAAVTANGDAGLVPYAAQARQLLAGQLRQRGRSGDESEAEQLAHAADATAAAIGMRLLAE